MSYPPTKKAKRGTHIEFSRSPFLPDYPADKAKWNFAESRVSTKHVRVAQELRRKDSIAKKLMGSKKLLDSKKCLIKPEETCDKLESLLDLFISDDTSKQAEREKTAIRLGYAGANLWFRKGYKMKRSLRKYKESVSDEFVQVGTCEQFSVDLVVMIDMSCIAESFSCPNRALLPYEKDKAGGRLPLISRGYKETTLKYEGKLGNFQNNLCWHPAGDGSCSFRLSGPEHQTKFFVDCISHVLDHCSGAPPDQERSERIHENAVLGFLSTATTRGFDEEPNMLQPPHTDLTHEQLERIKRRTKERNPIFKPDVDVPYPWNMDVPLNDNGMRLAMWGSEHHHSGLREVPVEIIVPPHHVLLWRADCVHAGALFDPQCGPGFRMHAYLPLIKEHEGIGEGKYHRYDMDGNSYASRLKRLDGGKYPMNKL